MTPAQEQTINEVRRLLKSQFDSWIVTYRITDENLRTKVNHDWHGDIVDIVGLSTMTYHRMTTLTDMKGVNDR